MDNKKTIRNLLIYLGIPIVLIIIIAVIFSSQRTEQPTTSEIVYYFKDMKVKEYTVDFGTGAIELKLNDDKGTVVKATAASITTFLDQINPYVDQYNEKHPDEPMKYDHIRASENSWLIDLLPNIILFGALVVFWIYFMRKLSNGMGGDGKTMGFGKAKIKSISDEKRKTTFADVAGADEEKEELREIVEFLKDPKKYNELGARIPKGVLLVGPPGTGKTLLARAVAGEAGVQFFSISGSDFVEMFVGVGASRVRDLFEQAKKNSPCIIFIDEIDAVGRQRGAGLGGGHDEREQTLNQLLVEMDGFGANEGMSSALIVWIGCSLGLFLADILGMLLGYLLKSKTPEGLLNTLAFAIFSVFGVFTLYQGLKLISTDIRSIPVLPILIVATIAFAGICVYLFLKREKKAKAAN